MMIIFNLPARCWNALLAARRLYIERTDARPLEAFLGELTTLWGIWLLLPMDSFAAAPAFAAMGHVFPEWAWGLGAAALGGSMLRGIVLGQRRPLRWGFIAASGLWLCVVGSLLLLNWTTTGTPIYLLILLKVFVRGARFG